MKKITALIVLTIPLMISALFLPNLAEASLPSVTVERLAPAAYQNSVSASGKMEEVTKSDIQCSFPIVPEEVYVSVGDQVAPGDAIAKVDLEKTKQALMNLISLSKTVPDEAVAVLAGLDLDYDVLASQIPTQITADSGGTISDLNLSKGVIYYPTETAATVSDLTGLRAKLLVPEDYAESIKVGQEVLIKSSALKNKKFLGKVTTIFPTAHETMVGTSQATVVGIYVSVDADSGLKSGYSVSGRVYTGEEEDMQTIGYEAVNQDSDGQEFVYVYDHGKAVRRNITTGTELETGIQVTEGLTGEEYVISNCSKIKEDGQYVSLAGGKEE